jgi:hypothetical protein
VGEIKKLKIGILKDKKIILFISVIFLSSFCLLIPASLGYGSSFSTAEIKLNGSYSENLAVYDYYAYYRVRCKSGDYLNVEAYVDNPSYDVDLDLYDESQYLVASGDYEVSYDVDDTTYFYIRVERITPSSGVSITFTLIIHGANGLLIPGFEIISLLLGVILIIGGVFLHVKKEKKITTFISLNFMIIQSLHH